MRMLFRFFWLFFATQNLSFGEEITFSARIYCGNAAYSVFSVDGEYLSGFRSSDGQNLQNSDLNFVIGQGGYREWGCMIYSGRTFLILRGRSEALSIYMKSTSEQYMTVFEVSREKRLIKVPCSSYDCLQHFFESLPKKNNQKSSAPAQEKKLLENFWSTAFSKFYFEMDWHDCFIQQIKNLNDQTSAVGSRPIVNWLHPQPFPYRPDRMASHQAAPHKR